MKQTTPARLATSPPETKLLFLKLANQPKTLRICVVFDAMLAMFGLMG